MWWGNPDTSIVVEIIDGRCSTIDALADKDPLGHGFLRSSWYGGAENDSLSRTVVAKRRCGTPIVAIPTIPTGPALIGARAVPGSYWPFRSVCVSPAAHLDELSALFDRPDVPSALGHVWRLGPVYAEDIGAATLVIAARRAGWTVLERELGTSFALDLTAAAEGSWPSRSSRRRLASYERRLAEVVGSVRVEVIRGAGWSGDVIDTLSAIEAESWVCRDTDRSGAKFATDSDRRRWLEMVRDPVIAESLSATILWAGAEPVAYSFDLRAGARQYGLATNYREAFAAYRPGRIVTMHQLIAAAREGVVEVDLGLGDSGYKQEMGARRGGRMVDYLFVRNSLAAAVIARRWCDPDARGLSPLRPLMPWIAATLATAGTVAFMAD